MSEFKDREPARLSGGQKNKRVAIAGNCSYEDPSIFDFWMRQTSMP
ncbi:hypothetical protein V6U65_10085 [Streptococcus salivarius]